MPDLLIFAWSTASISGEVSTAESLFTSGAISMLTRPVPHPNSRARMVFFGVTAAIIACATPSATALRCGFSSHCEASRLNLSALFHVSVIVKKVKRSFNTISSNQGYSSVMQPPLRFSEAPHCEQRVSLQGFPLTCGNSNPHSGQTQISGRSVGRESQRERITPPWMQSCLPSTIASATFL